MNSRVNAGAIFEVTINRPEFRHEIDLKTAKGLAAVFESFESDETLQVASDQMLSSNDAQEDARALVEKRSPIWSGS